MAMSRRSLTKIMGLIVGLVAAPLGPVAVAADTTPAPRGANASDPIAALLQSQGAVPVVISTRLGESAGRTRLVVVLSDPVAVQAFTLADPDRVVIDMPEVLWRIAADARPTGKCAV